MAKLNNKGISLVELIIAIAVMALLATPIIVQVSSTLEHSADAKERQHAIESADEVLEYFRKTDNAELKAGGNIDGTLNIVGTPTVTKDITCDLYDSTSGTKVETIKYTATDYVLNSVDLSRIRDSFTGVAGSADFSSQKRIYDRVVTVSDLNNKISEKKYEIDYKTFVFGSSLSAELSNVTMALGGENKKFEIESDNTVAIYDDDNHIRAIVVSEKDKEFQDPNTVSLGNIQDIDSSKMAVITGDATSLDYKLEEDLKASLVQYAYLPGNEGTSLGIYAHNDDVSGLARQIDNIISDNTTTPRHRLIHITITTDPLAAPAKTNMDGSVTPEVKPKYFHVRCDVIYKVSFTSSDAPTIFDNFTNSSGEFTYNVLDRDYYVSSPPDIYMVYEPLLLSTKTSGYTDYAHDDYISITTDQYTGGYLYKQYLDNAANSSSYVNYDPSKLYLIRSTKNWEKANGSTSILPDDHDYANGYLYRFSDENFYVGIHVNQIKTTVDPDKQLPIQIITNVSSYKDYHSLFPSMSVSDTDPWLQFKIASVASDTKAPTISDNYSAYPHYLSAVKDFDGNDAESIVTPLNDSRFEGKLYRMTVAYKKVESYNGANPVYGETIYLTGAKGAD